MQEGYQKLLVYETWKDSFSISKEMIEDSKLMDLRKQPGAFMTSYHRTRELFGAALYGGAIKAATTAQFKGKTFDITTADGQPLALGRGNSYVCIMDPKTSKVDVLLVN